MRFTKLSSIFFCCLLTAGLCKVSADAQKKDGKNSSQVSNLTPPTPYSEVRRDYLLNGMQIVTLPRMGDASVKIDLVIRAGAMFDLSGKTGQAKLTQESLLAVNPRLKEELESLQAKIDWGVNWDTTWFRIETPATSFESVLEIFARLLVIENIRPEAFKLAQQQLIEKNRARRLSPTDQADESFLKALYGEHPYGHNIDGTESTVAGMNHGDVYDFTRRLYLANDVSAIVVGKMSHDRAMRAFKTFFGGWIKGQIAPTTFRPPRQVAQLNLIKVETPDAPNVEMRGGVVGVKHSDPDFLTTEVMSRILTARLKRDDESSEVIAPPRILPGPFYFTASAPADKAPLLSRRITEAFATLATTPVSAEELAAAKSTLAAEYAARPVEHFLREIEVYSFPRNYPEKIAPNIEKITTAEVQRVAKKLLNANALTVLVLGKVTESFKPNP